MDNFQQSNRRKLQSEYRFNSGQVSKAGPQGLRRPEQVLRPPAGHSGVCHAERPSSTATRLDQRSGYETQLLLPHLQLGIQLQN